MLKPRDRFLLLESLRPPDGYALSHAVGTSYSLDLLALLTVPLAFTFYDWEDQEGRIIKEPLALLESLRRFADRIILFCHAGAIKLPPPYQRLMAYLENCVVGVRPKKDEHIFHPKIWVLRFESVDGSVRYRFVCLTRNLTFDCSWDTVLTMEGDLEQRKNAFSQNHPLGNFISSLPGLAVGEISDRINSTIEIIQDEVRKVRFIPPGGIEDYQFWPLGLDTRYQWPYPDTNRPMLIMSPFLKSGCLSRLMESRDQVTLISRPDELAKLPLSTLQWFSNIYTLDDAAEMDTDQESQQAEPGLSGLHAKLVVMDDGWKARVYTGSANATDAAFGGNIEFVTELSGKKKDLGVDALLGKSADNEESLLNLLRTWQASDEHAVAEDSLQEKLERKLRGICSRLARHPLEVNILEHGTEYKLQIVSNKSFSIPDSFTISCWPGTLSGDSQLSVKGEKDLWAEFQPISLEAITGFIAFEVTLAEHGETCTKRFALNLPLRNAPKDRLKRLLASILKDREQVIKLIWLLLQDTGAASIGSLQAFTQGTSDQFVTDLSACFPVFEALIRSASSNPGRIADVQRLVWDLQRSREGADLIPEGLVGLCEILSEYAANQHA